MAIKLLTNAFKTEESNLVQHTSADLRALRHLHCTREGEGFWGHILVN